MQKKLNNFLDAIQPRAQACGGVQWVLEVEKDVQFREITGCAEGA